MNSEHISRNTIDIGGPIIQQTDNKQGIMHLVECTCILSQYLRRTTPVFHKFVVFSVVNDNVVEEKLVQCNNCNIVHKVNDICKSTIVYGKDEARSAITIEDIKWSLNEKLIDLLTINNCELPTWEHAKFILNEERWGEHLILSTEIVDGRRVGKFAVIAGPDRFGVSQFNEPFDINTMV